MTRKSWKRRLLGCSVVPIVLGLLLPVFVAADLAVAGETIRLSLGGASTGTGIYLLAALLAETWKKNIPGMDITVLATAGSTANYIPMDKGELDLGMGATSGDFYALNGMYFTKSKISNFAVLLPATKYLNQAFTHADSRINAWKDLDGKTVCLGARGSPTSILNEEAFKVLGIKPKVIFSTPDEAIDRMKDRRADAMVYAVGAPWSGVMDVATAQKIKFLPMTSEEQKKVFAAYPYQVPDVIPAKTYSFQAQDLPTTAGFQVVNARAGLSEELVYRLVKTIWEQWPEVMKASPAARTVKAADILRMVAPVHPGAARYYREIGIQVPDRAIWKKN